MSVLATGLAGDSGDKLSRAPCKEREEGRASGTLIDNGLACLQNPAEILWLKHSTDVQQDGFLVHGSNKGRGNSETHVHLRFSSRNSPLIQTVGVLSYQSTWEQPPLYLRAVMGRGRGDKASTWGCLPAVTLPKGCRARGWLWRQLHQGICAQPAVGPRWGTTASLAATAPPLCMGHGSQSQSLNPRRVLAPALPAVAWTLQGKLMNSQPDAGAK